MSDAFSMGTVGGAIRLEVLVMPRSSRNGLGGVRDGRLIVRVTAPPVAQAANTAIVALLAEELDLPKSSVRIVSGAKGRRKTVEIRGTDEPTARLALGFPSAGG